MDFSPGFSLEMTSRLSLYSSAQLGSIVDTCSASVCGAFGQVAVFSAMLGSTADTSSCVRLRRLVLLLTLHLALCFFLSSGPRCAASWQWHVQGWYCWYFTLHAVFPFVVTGPDALHHGRYGPDVLGHGRSHARCVQRHMPMVQTAEYCACSAVAVRLNVVVDFLSWRRGSSSWS